MSTDFGEASCIRKLLKHRLDNEAKTKIFLKITGTTDKYEITYDQTAVKKKIISDLKKEVQELKDAFKQKGKKKKKELELEKDEYFDWDNNQ